MSNVRFDELELMLMAMFEQPTLKDTIQVLMEVQPLVAEDAEMAALVQQTIPNTIKFWSQDDTIKGICKSNGLLTKQIALTLLSSESNKLSLL